MTLYPTLQVQLRVTFRSKEIRPTVLLVPFLQKVAKIITDIECQPLSAQRMHAEGTSPFPSSFFHPGGLLRYGLNRCGSGEMVWKYWVRRSFFLRMHSNTNTYKGHGNLLALFLKKGLMTNWPMHLYLKKLVSLFKVMAPLFFLPGQTEVFCGHKKDWENNSVHFLFISPFFFFSFFGMGYSVTDACGLFAFALLCYK